MATRLAFLGALLLCVASVTNGESLWVDTTPQTPVPYALKKGDGIKLGGGNSFPVTGNSSGKAFCIMNTNGGSSGGAGVFPHVHKKTFENFYSVKGRVQLWGQNLDGYLANSSIQQTRLLASGDIGAIPPNTIHTFTLLEPDTQLTGVLVPGGFEEFFFHMSLAGPPDSGANSSLPGAGGLTVPELAEWDVYPQTDFVPRSDVVNAKAGPGNWYDGPNPLPSDTSAPIWIAKNYGPKFLNSENGRYQIIAPFLTGELTNDTFAQGTITLSPLEAGGDAPVVTSDFATAFMVEEGQLEVTVDEYDTASLIDGDVVFVPADIPFSYAATAAFTKFMYVSGGGSGLDSKLMAKAKEWDSAFYPSDNVAMETLGKTLRI